MLIRPAKSPEKDGNSLLSGLTVFPKVAQAHLKKKNNSVCLCVCVYLGKKMNSLIVACGFKKKKVFQFLLAGEVFQHPY